MVKRVTSDHPGIAPVQGFCTGICCLLLGLGCNLAVSADLLSVLRKAQQGQCKRRRSWLEGPSEALLLCRPAAPRGMGRASRSAESFAQLCSQRLNRGPSVTQRALCNPWGNPTKLGRKPAGTTARCSARLPRMGLVFLHHSTHQLWAGFDLGGQVSQRELSIWQLLSLCTPIHWRAQLRVLLPLNVVANYSTSGHFLH